MPRSLDFQTLDLRDALDLAILVEEEARERYAELARQVGGRYAGDASDVFERMAGNEAKHARQLSERRAELFGTTPRRVSPLMFWQIEAPDAGEVRVFMSPIQVWKNFRSSGSSAAAAGSSRVASAITAPVGSRMKLRMS